MFDVLEVKFQEVCDYFDFMKLARCLEKLEEEGFCAYSVTELKDTAQEHFETLVGDLKTDPELDYVRIDGDSLELIYDEGELELRSKLVESETAKKDEEQ